MTDDIKDIVEELPLKTIKRVLALAIGLLLAIATAAIAMEVGWRQGLIATDKTLGAAVAENKLDIAKLAVATSNLKESIESLASIQSQVSQGRDERNKRMERLLDLLEKQAYSNTAKEK